MNCYSLLIVSNVYSLGMTVPPSPTSTTPPTATPPTTIPTTTPSQQPQTDTTNQQQDAFSQFMSRMVSLYKF